MEKPASADQVFHKKEFTSRRRHPRVTLSPLHSVSFQIDGAQTECRLGNLSISGMGIFTSSLSQTVKCDDLLEGVLVCGTDRVRVVARVVHVGKAQTGCQFVGHDAEVNKWVQNYFSLELSAMTMIAVNPTLLQEDPDGTPHWIHGKNNCEIFFITNGEKVIRFNLTFFGNYVEGGEGMRPKYGQIVEEENSVGKPRHKASALIRWDANLAGQMEKYAIRFLESIPHLQDIHRNAISQMLVQK